eukprot:scaffold2957_cov226-Isochrysis_galbana.AAC.14
MTRILTTEIGTHSLVSKNKGGNKGVPLEVPSPIHTKHLTQQGGRVGSQNTADQTWSTATPAAPDRWAKQD